MFSFISEFLNDLNVETSGANNLKDFKYVNFNNEVFYFQNFKDIILISDTEIILKLFGGEVSICGSNLHVKEISKQFVVINGKINKVEVLNV